MFYKIVHVELKTEADEKSVIITPVSVTVQIQMQDSDAVETHVVQLNDGDWKQFTNLLRQRVDGLLNGGQ